MKKKMRLFIAVVIGVLGLIACQSGSHAPISFVKFEVEADGVTEDGVPAAMSIKFDIPKEENDMQETIIENYKQLIKQTEIGKTLDIPLEGSLQDIAKAYADYFPKGIKARELSPAMYVLWIESGYQTEQSVNFVISSGIFGNGGPYQDIVVMNRYDNSFLRTEELLNIPHVDLEKLAQKYTTDPDINLNDLIEGYYQIVPDSAGCMLHYLIGSHLFGEIRMPVSAVEPYLTDAGKEVFGLVKPSWWDLTTRGISPLIRYLLYGLGGLLALLLLFRWSAHEEDKKLQKKIAKVNAELDNLQHAADKGDAHACAELAQRYINGHLVRTDLEKSIALAQKALELGNSNARVILGMAYFERAKKYMEGVSDIDVRKGIEYYRLSAECGEARAYNNLAICYFNGKGVKQNAQKGLDLATKSYKMGNMKACDTIAAYYILPKYGVNDRAMGFKWSLIGAKGGEWACQRRTALAYDLGEGVEKNEDEAYKWFEALANNYNASNKDRGLGYYHCGKILCDKGRTEEGKSYIRIAKELKNDLALKYGDHYLYL